MFALKQPAQLRQKLEQLQARASASACSLALHFRSRKSAHTAERQEAGQDNQGERHAAGQRDPGSAPEAGRRGTSHACFRLCMAVRIADETPPTQLSPDEVEFMQKHMTEGLAAFQKVTDNDCKSAR
jgi:hypothetical protein